MRKHVAFLLCLSIVLCLTACGRPQQLCTGYPPPATEPQVSGAIPAATVRNVDGGSLAYTTKVAYANSGGTRLLTACLNADSMYISSVQHLPVFKFETASDLQNFKTAFADTLTFDRGYDEIPSFDSYAADYDDVFFQSRTLILCYVQASSGSYRYGIADVSVGGDTLCLFVKQLNHPQCYTADVQGWFVLAEVSKTDMQNCKHFDAQMVAQTE